MTWMFKAFLKQLFGAKYERLGQALSGFLLVFLSLSIAGFQVVVRVQILYLMSGAFSAGILWQALKAKNRADQLQNMLMLPFDNGKFVFSYIASLGVYVCLTKTAILLALLWAVSSPGPAEIFGSVLCAVLGVLLAAAVFARRQQWYAVGLWVLSLTAILLFFGERIWFWVLAAGNGAIAVWILYHTDGYSFIFERRIPFRQGKIHSRHSIWRYFFRYLLSHKNYLANTAILWGVACVLPLFLEQMGNLFTAPVGFSILSMNTPVCILLSCDPDLLLAVHALPGQRKAFCLPYGLFLFCVNLAADGIFLCSLQLQNGGVTILTMFTALFFALQSAILSVLLEWFCPIRGWKIESDLWHHPRKYLVPAGMLLLAGAVGVKPAIVPWLLLLLAAEVAGLLIWCRRDNA